MRRRRWTWVWAAVTIVGVVLVVLAAIALLAQPRKQVHPLESPAQTSAAMADGKNPAGVPTGPPRMGETDER